MPHLTFPVNPEVRQLPTEADVLALIKKKPEDEALVAMDFIRQMENFFVQPLYAQYLRLLEIADQDQWKKLSLSTFARGHYLPILLSAMNDLKASVATIARREMKGSQLIWFEQGEALAATFEGQNDGWKADFWARLIAVAEKAMGVFSIYLAEHVAEHSTPYLCWLQVHAVNGDKAQEGKLLNPIEGEQLIEHFPIEVQAPLKHIIQRVRWWGHKGSTIDLLTLDQAKAYHAFLVHAVHALDLDEVDRVHDLLLWHPHPSPSYRKNYLEEKALQLFNLESAARIHVRRILPGMFSQLSLDEEASLSEIQSVTRMMIQMRAEIDDCLTLVWRVLRTYAGKYVYLDYGMQK